VHERQQIVLGSGREISKATLFAALNVGGWLTTGVVVFAWGVSVRGPLLAGLDEVSWIICAIVLSLCFRMVYRRARSTAVSYLSLGLLALFFSFVGALAWYESYLAVLRVLLAGLTHWLGGANALVVELSTIALRSWIIPVRTLITCACLLLTWSSLYFCINAIIDFEVQRERAARAEKLADRARLSALQTQLNPHFLFNALNGIASLIRANKQATAASMVDELGSFLHSTLRKLDSPEIRVAEELELVNQYLQIQRRRFGKRLRTNFLAEPQTMDACVPTLILQPLVENALQHGILTLEDGGSINILISKSDDKLEISVENDGAGTDVARHATGLGLRNCSDRLMALYGDNARLSAGRCGKQTGFLVCISLPFRQEVASVLRSEPVEVMTEPVEVVT
jgi:sensor histidine kinase YesM